ICTCDGETVWALGFFHKLEAPNPRTSYSILRQFRLSDGKELRAVLDRLSFPRSPLPVEGGSVGDLYLQCRGDKVGFYAGSLNEWIECDVARDQLNRWKLPKLAHHRAEQDDSGKILPRPPVETFITGLAMLDSGDVYASFWQIEGRFVRRKPTHA